jgi:O-methyltransferase domain/Dimerisation domain
MNTPGTAMSTPAPAGPTPAEQVLQLSIGYMISSALHVAAKLEIADRLIKGPRSVQELAEDTSTTEDGLYRTLRALASIGVFEETTPRHFGLTPLADTMRKDVDGVRDMVLWICDPLHLKTYGELMHSVRTGQPAVEKVVRMPVFDYFARDPALSDVFNNAMTMFSALVIPAVLEAYDFSGIKILVDVAGGHGHILTSILQKYPDMRGVLLDIEHVIAGAGPLIAKAGVSDRCRTEIGDFFKAVPAGGDAYIMKHILHDWDDDRAETILRNIRVALDGKPDGRVILIEAVIAPGNQPDLSKFIDLEMLMLPGGRERTAEEFASLFGRSGLKLTRIVPTKSPLAVVEAML